MFTRSRQLFATGMFVVDAVLIAGAWLGAYWLRFHGLDLPAPLGVPPLRLYLWSGAVLTPTALLVLRTFHLYRSAPHRSSSCRAGRTPGPVTGRRSGRRRSPAGTA